MLRFIRGVSVFKGEFSIPAGEWLYLNALCDDGIPLEDLADHFGVSRNVPYNMLKKTMQRLDIDNFDDLIRWYHNRYRG